MIFDERKRKIFTRGCGGEGGGALRGRFWSGKGQQHHQLSIYSALELTKSFLPDDAICLVSLTTEDLYESEPDLFVAGMAAGNQRVAVFSLFRYSPTLTFSPELWYDVTAPEVGADEISAEKSRCVLLQRGCRLLVHEISHLLGMDHCVFFDCCMNGSGHLEEDFRQSMHLCPVDLRKLHTLIGFDVCARYEKLQTFYAQHNMKPEAEWVRNRLSKIQDD